MKEYNIKVNFKDGTIDNDGFIELVENDYNTTTLNFEFDINARIVLKILYPDNTIAYVNDVVNNQYVFQRGLLSKNGMYEMELSAYDNSGRLTNYATMSFYVRPELVKTDEIVEPDDRVPILDSLINEVNQSINETNNLDIDAVKIDDIATITITKKDGTEETVDVKDGKDGKDGVDGKDGKDGIDGTNGTDGTDGTDGFSPIANVSKSNGTAIITITDKNGTTTATVSDGINGTNGRDGVDGQNGRDGYVQYNSSNKLNADYVDDSNSTNKFVTATDKTTWSGKQDALVFNTAYDGSTNKVATMADISSAISSAITDALGGSY